MDKLALSADDKAFVMDELRAKLDIDAVAGAAETPEEAAEIYTASPRCWPSMPTMLPSAATSQCWLHASSSTTRWSRICSRRSPPAG